MAKEMRITFEMILDEFEGQVSTQQLRRMWQFTIDLLNQFQAQIDEYELHSCDCCASSTRASKPESDVTTVL